MQTIKTAAVVVLMLAVLYGVYITLNKPEFSTTQDASWKNFGPWEAPPRAEDDLKIEFGQPTAAPGSESAASLAVSGEGAAPGNGPAGESRAAQDAIEHSVSDRGENPPAIPPPSFLATPDGELATPTSAAVPVAADSTGEAPPPAALQGDFAGAVPPTPFVPGDAEPVASDPVGSEPAAPAEPASDFAPAEVAEAAPLAAGADPAPQESDLPGVEQTFASAWTTAVAQVEEQQYADALLTLSFFFDDASLTSDERQQLLDALDPLAAKVIYSTEHHLLAPYEVAAGETLAEIAARHQLTVELLQNINGLASGAELPAGTTLKVLQGPFRAQVSLSQRELTLFVGRMYAGRFALGIGNDPAPTPGELLVREKSPGHIYVAADGSTLPAEDPRNPYGGYWLDLGNELGLHGQPANAAPPASSGCLSLSPADARDVYSILAEGAVISIGE